MSPNAAPALEPDLIERLLIHDWPFNIRELVLLVRRLVVLHAGESSLRADHLPERIGVTPTSSDAAATPGGPSLPWTSTAAPTTPPAAPSADDSAEPVGFRALMGALRVSSGNVARAAAMLGITRQRAYRLMEGRDVDLTALRRPPEDSG